MKSSTHKLTFWMMVLSSIAVALVSYRFVFLGLSDAFGGGELIPALLVNERTLFIAHVIASPIALALGGLQFIKRIRKHWPDAHRWMGRVYGLSILIGGLAGLGLALSTFEARPLTSVGFILLSVAWLTTTALGIRAARHRDFQAHRAWMVYAFALTFSAVTLRLQLAGAQMMGFDYDSAAIVLAWSCWVPNLIVAALILRGSPAQTIQKTLNLPASLSILNPFARIEKRERNL